MHTLLHIIYKGLLAKFLALAVPIPPEEILYQFRIAYVKASMPLQVIEPVRSRCLCVRIAAPTEDQICQMITYVGDQEGVEVPEELKNRLAKVRPS